MKFRNEQHEKDYNMILRRMQRVGVGDEYHRAAAYLLALDEVLVSHVEDIFDLDEDGIKPETALHHPWQTGTSRKTTRLLMNLWNGCISDFEDGADADVVSSGYAVSNIFSCYYAPYYWEAIKLRYPSYCNE